MITIQEQSFKQEASQGQRKSLLFAIRLAEWELLKKAKGFSPILLMDDIFEKLDEQRMAHLLGWVATSTDGPVFITDTHKARVADLLGRYVENFQLIEL
jgi:DNA replication and repair protein RecF